MQAVPCRTSQNENGEAADLAGDRSHEEYLIVHGFCASPFSTVEGISTLVLFLIAMPLKYVVGYPMAVTYVGWVHGVLFVGLWLMFLTVAGMRKITLSPRTCWGCSQRFSPFGPFLIDGRLRKFVVKAQTSREKNLGQLLCGQDAPMSSTLNPAPIRTTTLSFSDSILDKSCRSVGEQGSFNFWNPRSHYQFRRQACRSTAELLDLGRVLIKPELYLASADFLTRFTQRDLPQVPSTFLLWLTTQGLRNFCGGTPQRWNISPQLGFQLMQEVDDWLLTGVEPPSGCRQFSASGGIRLLIFRHA